MTPGVAIDADPPLVVVKSDHGFIPRSKSPTRRPASFLGLFDSCCRNAMHYEVLSLLLLFKLDSRRASPARLFHDSVTQARNHRTSDYRQRQSERPLSLGTLPSRTLSILNSRCLTRSVRDLLDARVIPRDEATSRCDFSSRQRHSACWRSGFGNR